MRVSEIRVNQICVNQGLGVVICAISFKKFGGSTSATWSFKKQKFCGPYFLKVQYKLSLISQKFSTGDYMGSAYKTILGVQHLGKVPSFNYVMQTCDCLLQNKSTLQ